ncbi:MAG: stage 0 sporulation family protein [Bacilli bacterium]
MAKVVYIKCTENNFYVSCTEKLFKGEKLVVNIDKSLFIAEVLQNSKLVNDKDVLVSQLIEIVRKATISDLKIHKENIEKNQKITFDIKKIVKKYKLKMNVLNSIISIDNKKIIVKFTADSRIDFRELVKELASKYKMRIELKQIGVRDKSAIVSGIGPCGLLLCCATFLYKFAPITISMAKNQNIALNPDKINGVCGRLLCCLGYENDLYIENRKGMPKYGELKETEYGISKVVNIDIYKRQYTIETPNDGRIIISLGDINDS